MLGFNGGLMGVRRTSTTGAASGLWFQNEQSVAQRAAIWPLGITNINVASITYTQSSVYSGTSAATNANMTDNSTANTGTATNADAPGWVRMDLGQLYVIGSVIVGTGTSSIPGGWSYTYTENCNVQYSSDASTWTTAFNTGTFGANGIYTFTVSFTARYIRIANPSTWLALTEFYALAPGQTYP